MNKVSLASKSVSRSLGVIGGLINFLLGAYLLRTKRLVSRLVTQNKKPGSRRIRALEGYCSFKKKAGTIFFSVSSIWDGRKTKAIAVMLWQYVMLIWSKLKSDPESRLISCRKVPKGIWSFNPYKSKALFLVL